ncbi:hypothetical protein Q3G72_033138 [Acer saccharum]|nr:hypothetical protein Q3G72_033138 [Acer saccharum]
MNWVPKLRQSFQRRGDGKLGEDFQPVGNLVAHNHNNPIEESNSIKSVYVVKETKESSDSNSFEDVSEEDLDREEVSFKTISATREAGEVEIDPFKANEGYNLSTQFQVPKRQRKKKNMTRIRGGEITSKEDWNVDEEVNMVMDIGTRLGLDFFDAPGDPAVKNIINQSI